MCTALGVLGLPASAFAAPTTTLVGVPTGWTNSDVTFSLLPDADSVTYYVLGTGAQQTYTSAVSVSTEGATQLQYWSVLAGCDDQVETPKHATIQIDKTAPSSTIGGLPASEGAPAPFTFTISGSDALSGVGRSFYRINGGAQQTYTAPVPVNPTGSTVIDYWSVDNAGNAEVPKTATVGADNGLPRTTISGVPVTWSASDVTFSLSAAPSAASGQPVAATYYALGGGAVTPYTAPVLVTSEGATSVSYCSVDAVGAREATRTDTVRIDKTAPVSSVSGIPGTPSHSAVTFTLSASDGLSGVAAIRYKLNGGATTPYTAPVTIASDGNTTLSYWAVDAAGNSETPHSALIQVDLGVPSTTVSGVPAGWSKADVTASLSATITSSVSTVAATYYTYGTGPETPYSGPMTLNQEGNRTLSYYSVSSTGVRETSHSTQVRIDKTAPASSVSGIPGTPSHSAVTFSLSATDALSGVSAIRYQLGGGAAQDYTVPVTVATDGNTTLSYWAVDAAGNSETPHSALIQVDLGVPSTTVSGVPGAWSKTDVTLTLSATIDSSFSTVAATYYTYGTGSETPYSAPVTLNQEGDRTLSYYSVSSTGVHETTHSTHVRIDKTAPVSSVSGIPAGASATAVTFSLSASDALSGVSAIRYQLGGGAAQDYSAPVTVSADGVTALTYWAVDAAGNSEAPHSAQIEISTPPLTVPETTIGGVPASWSSKDVTFTLSPHSPDHAVTGTYYRIGSGGFAAYTGPVAVTAQGVTTVTYYSTDDAGGREADKTAQIRIDKTAPASSASGLPAANTTVPGPVVFSLSASDALSGVAAIRYRLGGGSPLDYSGPVTVTNQGATPVAWWAVDAAGNAEVEHTALIQIGAPAGDVATSVTIKSSAASVRIGSTPVLSGVVTPVGLVGTIMVVYVQKPGSARWTYSSNRGVYLSAGNAAWLYKYFFKPGMTRGTYKFKAVVPASPGFLGSESKPISIAVK